MELTGDPVLDYLEELQIACFTAKYEGLRLPRSIRETPDDVLRVLLINTQSLAVCVLPDAPKPPDVVRIFMEGGGRPPITG